MKTKILTCGTYMMTASSSRNALDNGTNHRHQTRGNISYTYTPSIPLIRQMSNQLNSVRYAEWGNSYLDWCPALNIYLYRDRHRPGHVTARNTRAAAAMSLWRAAAAAAGRGGVATLAAAVSSSNRGASQATAARLLTDWQPLHHKKCYLVSVHRKYGEFVGASIRNFYLCCQPQQR